MISEKRYRRICEKIGINPEAVSPAQLKAMAATKGLGKAALHAAMECSKGLNSEDYAEAVRVLGSRK